MVAKEKFTATRPDVIKIGNGQFFNNTSQARLVHDKVVAVRSVPKPQKMVVVDENRRRARSVRAINQIIETPIQQQGVPLGIKENR